MLKYLDVMQKVNLITWYELKNLFSQRPMYDRN